MKKIILFSVVLIAYAILFGLLFGSNQGIFGSYVHSFDLTLKTKMINSIAIYGYLMLGITAWFILSEQRENSRLGLSALLALFLSLTYGFVSVDCAMFEFCR
jgi:hypothetical protein